ncbi:uncharacterized protein TNCV_5023411 [Trichonephila clavipes]|nr:uncharacterized protein TNCV_5023411 [Trichonephila clavipes]
MSAYEPNSRHLPEVLIFCFNMKKSAAEAHRMLSNTYGEAAISERTYREWFHRFKNGDFDVEDQHGIWWDQLGVVYYDLLKPTETITGDRYRTQLLNHKCIISFFTIKPRISEKNGGSKVVHLIIKTYDKMTVDRLSSVYWLICFN